MGNLLTKDLLTIFSRKKRILITTFLGKSREVEDRFRKQDTFKVVEVPHLVSSNFKCAVTILY